MTVHDIVAAYSDPCGLSLECSTSEQFLTLNPMNRNKKQIQDKVRQLYLSSFFDLS